MDNFRKVLAIGLTAVCVVFGLPANAQNPSKQVTLTMVGPSDTSKTVVANLFNHSNPSGGGTSNFGSAQLIVDTHTSGMRITLTDLKLERVDTSNNATPVTGVSVALSSDGSTLSITGISPNISAQSTLRVTMTMSGCGAGIGWSATAYPGSNLTGNPFAIDSPAGGNVTSVSCESLACNDAPVDIPRDASTPNVTVQRGPYDSDGRCSTTTTETRIYVNNQLFAPALSVLLTWPFSGSTDSDQQAAFSFDAKVTVPTGVQQKLAYKTYTSTQGTTVTDSGIPAFLNVADGLFCSGQNKVNNVVNDWFPRPYGTLAADVKAGDKTIKVGRPVTVPATTYVDWPIAFSPPVNLIVDNELMRVTKINTNTGTWTVTRAADQPQGTQAPTHSAGAPVMYTPLNLLSVAPACLNIPTDSNGHALYACPYTQGELAKACVGVGTGTDPTANPYKIIGIGDPVWSGGDL